MPTTPAQELATSLDVRSPHSSSVTAGRRSAIWLFPGLGCRYVGMGHDLIGQHPAADQLIVAAEGVLNYSIAELCLEGSGRKYVSPRHEAQAIYVLDCAYAAVLRQQGFIPSVVAGHSLGSLAAGTVCGAYDFLTGLSLVTRIEDLMEELIDGRDQAMGFVIGVDEPAMRQLLSEVPDVYLANWNSPLQHVVGGQASSVELLLSRAQAAGAKQAKRFGNGRAMHTPCVEDVAARFRETLLSVRWTEPNVLLVNGHDTSILRTASQIQEFLGAFLSQPVHWQAAIQSVQQSWGSRFVEVGPGSLLTTMLPFIDRHATIQTASDLLDRRVMS